VTESQRKSTNFFVTQLMFAKRMAKSASTSVVVTEGNDNGSRHTHTHSQKQSQLDQGCDGSGEVVSFKLVEREGGDVIISLINMKCMNR
jgi:hypothetical protein